MATIELRGIDAVGILNEITNVISTNMAVNMRNININTKQGIFEGKITLQVHDVNEVEKLCLSLKEIKAVKTANRINN